MKDEPTALVNLLSEPIKSKMIEAQAVVKAELDNLKTRFDSQGVYDFAAIKSKVDDIITRFSRLYLYAATISNELGSNARFRTTLDQGARLQQGFDIFLAQEKRMLELDNQRLKVANDGALGSKRLDAPTLVFLLQQFQMLVTEANNSALAEEANQFNDLLKVYNAMQSKINELVKSFDVTQANQKRNFLAVMGKDRKDLVNGDWNQYLDDETINNNDNPNLAGNPPDAVRFFDNVVGPNDPTAWALFYMFNKNPGGGFEGPLERLYGIDRPTTQMWTAGNPNKLVVNFRDAWNAFGTQLGDTVSQINQQSQVLSNKINSAEKEKNRYFEQANGALTKLYDVMNNVTRGIT